MTKLKNTDKTDKEVIILCDREADLFELLDDLYNSNCKYVIRCKWDRPTKARVKARKNKFSILLNISPIIGNISLLTIDPNTREENQKIFSLKSLENVMLPPAHRLSNLPLIKINVFEVSNQESKWLLFTNLHVKTLANVIFVVQSYKRRWHTFLIA